MFCSELFIIQWSQRSLLKITTSSEMNSMFSNFMTISRLSWIITKDFIVVMDDAHFVEIHNWTWHQMKHLIDSSLMICFVTHSDFESTLSHWWFFINFRRTHARAMNIERNWKLEHEIWKFVRSSILIVQSDMFHCYAILLLHRCSYSSNSKYEVE